MEFTVTLPGSVEPSNDTSNSTNVDPGNAMVIRREGTVEELLRDHVDFLDTCLKESMLTSAKLLKVSCRDQLAQIRDTKNPYSPFQGS